MIGTSLGSTLGHTVFAESTLSHGKTITEILGETLSREEQDSVALELERVANSHADRLMTAANVGQWETAITFVSRTATGREILAGSLRAEFAKPSVDMLPLRVRFESVGPDRPLLLPATDELSSVFSKSLASYLTSEELASISMPPVEQLPGYDVRSPPQLGLAFPDTKPTDDTHSIGCVCENGESLAGTNVTVASDDLAGHLFVCGITGSGKTTTVKEVLASCDVPFLVVESAKREYRQLLGAEKFRDTLQVYTVGDDSLAPISLNPFFVLPGISLFTHIDFLKAIFNASFSLYGPMPYILEQCIQSIYEKIPGWNKRTGLNDELCSLDGIPDPEKYYRSQRHFPTISDLKKEIVNHVDASKYKGEISDNIQAALITRLESLCVGAKGKLFDSREPMDIGKLLETPTVLELEALSDDDDKAFFVGMMLAFISEYRQCNNLSVDPFGHKSDKSLVHLLVVEEAHRLLKNVAQERQTEQLGNPRGKALEFFSNVLSEMRSMGQGVVVSEQIPTKLLPDVIKNTNTKIVHRLVSADDQKLVANSLGLQPGDARYLNSLETGHALYFMGGMAQPVEIKVTSTLPTGSISHSRVKRQSLIRNRSLRDAGNAGLPTNATT